MERINILYAEADVKSLAELRDAFAAAGHRVTIAVGRSEMQRQLSRGTFDVAVLGPTLPRDDRHHLPYMIRKAQPHAAILVLHASGRHPEVDLAMDSRRGVPAVLATVQELARRSVAA